MEEQKTLQFERLAKPRRRLRLYRYQRWLLLMLALATVGAVTTYIYRDRVNELIQTVQSNISSMKQRP